MSVEVMVVIFGMVLLVPGAEVDGRTDELTGVFVNGSHMGKKMEHKPMVLVPSRINRSWRVRTNLLDRSDAEFTLTIEPSDGDADEPKIDLAARRDSVELDLLIGGGGGVDPDCVANRASCTMTRHPGHPDLVPGTLKVRGEWRTSGVSYCSTHFDWRPVSFCDQSTYEFRPLPHGDGSQDRELRPLASALRLDTTVDALADLSVSVSFSDGKTRVIEFEKMTGIATIGSVRARVRRWRGNDAVLSS